MSDVWQKKPIDRYTVGSLLACIYIFMSYVAQDVIISSAVCSVCLYVFLLFSAYVAVTEIGAPQNNMGFILWYFAFLIMSCLVAVYTPGFSQVFASLYSGIVSFFVFLFLQLYVKREGDFCKIAWCYAVSSVAFVILLFLTGNLTGEAGDRLGQDLLGNANIFAMMMMVATMYSLWLLVYQAKGFLSKCLLLCTVAADFYALILSGGRKYFLIPLIFFYILLLYRRDENGKKHMIRYTILFAVIVGTLWLAIMNVPAFYNAIGVRMEGLITTLSGGQGDNSSLIREEIRNLAFDGFLKSPLFGHGFDSFKFLAKREVGHFYYSHCNYTELLYNGGIFYFLFYYWMYWKILRRCRQNDEMPSSYKAFSVATVISLAVFDYGAVTYNSTSTIIMLMLAYVATNFRVHDHDAMEGDFYE